MTCEGKKEETGIGWKKEGECTYEIVPSVFSVSNHVLGIFMSQTWISCLNLSITRVCFFPPLFFFFITSYYPWNYMWFQSRRREISAIKNLKLRQHGKCTKKYSFKRAKSTYMPRNRFSWKTVFFSWIEENRKKIRHTLLYSTRTPVKAEKGWAEEACMFSDSGF